MPSTTESVADITAHREGTPIAVAPVAPVAPAAVEVAGDEYADDPQYLEDLKLSKVRAQERAKQKRKEQEDEAAGGSIHVLVSRLFV